MKPNFALHLTHEGITLLHRAKAGWLRVGDVALDAPDFEEQLKVLRRTASDLENGGLTSKLVIPESQILYTTIEVRGRDTAAQIAQIREGLIGLTPYEVKDLVFDWRIKGTRAQVAVVARDTLQEAEAFAAEFRFNPVSFVAMPEAGGFEGEPFFGPTKHAATLLEGDERIEPDKAAMVVMSAARPKPQIRVAPLRTKPAPTSPATAVVSEPDTTPQPGSKDATAKQAPKGMRPAASELQSDVAKDMPLFDRVKETSEPLDDVSVTGKGSEPALEPAAGGGLRKETAADVQPETAAAMPDPVAPAAPHIEPEPELIPVAFSSRRRGAASVPEPTIRPRAELPPLETQPEPARSVVLDPIPAPAKTATPKIQPSITLPQPAAKPKPAPEEASPAALSPAARAADIGTIGEFRPLDDIPEMPPSFGTLRGGAGAAKGLGTGHGRGITPMPMTSASVAGASVSVSASVDARADAAASSLTKTISRSDNAVGTGASGLRKTARNKALAAGGAVAGAVAGTVANTVANTVTGTVSGTIGLLNRGTAAGVKRLRARPTAVAASNTEAQAMTVFGERNQSQIGGKPRFLGLMLTLSLLLALAVLALWSTFFLSDSNPGVFDNADETPQIAAVEPGVSLTPEGTPDPLVAAGLPEVSPETGPEAGPEIASPEITAIQGPGSDEIGAAVDSVLAGILGTETGPETGPEETGPDAGQGTALPDTAAIDAEEDLTALAQQPEILSEPAPDQVLLPPPSRIEAEASYAATGIWQLDPEPLDALPPGDRLEDVFVASLDPNIAEDDLSDLPPVAGLLNDRNPEALRAPAPLGTRFDFDERGFIRATPDGAMTPDGVQVFAGAPAYVPPARPGTEPPLRQPESPVPTAPVNEAPATPEQPVTGTTLTEPVVTEPPLAEVPATQAPAVETPETETETVQEQVLTPEQQRLQNIRPIPRPGSLEETTNRALPLNGLVAGALAPVAPEVRPELRPASLEVALPKEEPAQETAAVTTTAPEADTQNDDGTELAVLVSRTPVVRPRDLAPPVQNDDNSDAVEEPTAPVAPPAPNVAAAIVPNVPARASVAKAATERNAINLSRVNLIGVYGSASDRRALIRLKSGRYVKVEVGDRVDGGRVSAISDNELLYVKGGRNITLQMPQG